MSLFGLIIKNLRGHLLRSTAILLSVMGITCFLLATTITINGTEYSMNTGIKRMGADILVVGEGGEYQVQTTPAGGCGGPQLLIPTGGSVLLMGKSSDMFMPESKLAEIYGIAGVEAASPQVFLNTLLDSPYCSASEMYLVVFDPVSDFTLRPWLDKQLGGELGRDEIIGGSEISADAAGHLSLYGRQVTLAGNLQASGTGIDQSLFMTMQTAQDIAESSKTTPQTQLKIPSGEISAIMVKTSPKADVHLVAINIASAVKGVVPVESPSMFGAFRQQVTGLLWGAIAIMVIFWGVGVYLIGLIFSASANERRREVAVLRALGAERRFIFLSIIGEALVLALGGGLPGIALASLAASVFGHFIATSLGIPFMFPGLISSLRLMGAGTVLIMLTVTLAVFLPAYRMSRMEPAIAARE